MRISSISIAQPANVNYKMRTRKAQARTMQMQQPAFKGWRAGAGYLIGAGIGATVGTVLSGGLLVPFILGATGAISGGTYGKSKEGSDGYDDYNYDPGYPTSRDS